MDNVISTISHIWGGIIGVISGITVGDILDIILMAFLIYKAIQLVQETHAGQLLKGIIILIFANVIANLLDMTMLTVILQNVWSIGLIAIIVLFQPELRHALERLGRSKLSNLGKSVASQKSDEIEHRANDSVCKACASMSASKTGALIVFEKETILNQIIESGTALDCSVSSELLCNIFFNKAPLHDGAVIISGGRIVGAGCFLPLTNRTDLAHELGTRHRAAIGMSESSDAVVVVVSEETGIISVAYKGELLRDFDVITLKTKLEDLLFKKEAVLQQVEKAQKSVFSFIKKGDKK